LTQLELLKEPLVFCGHSMGGSLAVHTALKLETLGSVIAALIVIDVVEGSAMGALRSMHGVLKSRPKSFRTLKNAIRWSRSSQV